MQISCAVTVQLISIFVVARWIVRSLYLLNQKFHGSSHLLWLYSPVCVGAGLKPRKPVFSRQGSNHIMYKRNCAWSYLMTKLFILHLSYHAQHFDEPRCEKTGLRGFRPDPTETGLYSHRRWLEACNFVFRK